MKASKGIHAGSQTELFAREAAQISEDIVTAADDIKNTAIVVRRNSGVAKDTAENSQRCNSVVRKLVGATNDISNISASIVDISKKINLLALNASIEAARAGEAGRGFAVVANEVKELASYSEKATKGIQQCINEILKQGELVQDFLTDIVEATTGIYERASKAADGFDKKATVMNDIAQRMQELHSMSENISK